MASDDKRQARAVGPLKAPEFVAGLIRIASGVLMAGDRMTAAEAAALAEEIARAACWEWSKTLIYIPSHVPFELRERDLAMWEAYGQPGPTGSRPYTAERVVEIAQQYGISMQWAYSVLRSCRQAAAARAQGQLDLDEPDQAPQDAAR